MPLKKTKSLSRLHLIGFLITAVGLICLVFYQLFVTPKFTRLPLSQFFRLQTFKQAFQPPIDPGQPQDFPDPNPLSVICHPDCVFSYQDQLIPAIIDNDPAAQLTELTPNFFDPQAGLIGYQNQDPLNPTFYVINLQSQLLQTIRLNLNQFRLLEFVNYYPQTRKILFKSAHQTTGKIEYWFYSATEPSLEPYQP